MVALIVGINLGAYAAYRLLGSRGGALVAGTLGGFISSTATTVSQARGQGSPDLAALVIQLASTLVFARVLLEVAVASPDHFTAIAPPIAIVGAAFVAAAVVLWLRVRTRDAEAPPPATPAELKPALLFGAAYAIVLLAAAAAKEHLGNRGLYVVAVLSGLTDMDAITLSTSQLANQGRLDTHTGWRLILVASMANLAFKAGMVAVLGSRELLKHVIVLFGAALAAGAAILLFWPTAG
jgi:uncharacterized membrane protein (DUF4010 family)